MKIALIAHLKYPIAEPFAGGLEMHTHMLARRLMGRGHEVTLFAAEGSDPTLNLVAVVPPTGTPTGRDEEVSVALAERRAYAAIVDHIALGGFDIVHNNSLHWLPLAFSDRFAPPMVTVFHTPPFEDLAVGVAARAEPHTAFVAVSEAMARMWAPVVEVDGVIPNGIELERFRQQHLRPVATHAVWSGRIVPEKGLHLALEAARFAGIPLRFAGPIADQLYWDTVIAPMLDGRSAYLGHLGHAALAAEVARAGVAVVTPCFDEPFGLVVAEALGCGTPVAGFARGALPDLLDEATGRLVPPGDVAALATAMSAALTLSRSACRARAEALWDAGAMVCRYEALYLGLLARTARILTPRVATSGIEAIAA